MAGGAKGDRGEAEPAVAGAKAAEPIAANEADGELEFIDWSYRLLSLERVQADGENDEDEDYFTAKFQVDGPNANAEVEIVVSDFTDEAHVVSIAQHTLHVAMTMWGRVTSDRFIKARAVDLPKRGTSRRR